MSDAGEGCALIDPNGSVKNVDIDGTFWILQSMGKLKEGIFNAHARYLRGYLC